MTLTKTALLLTSFTFAVSGLALAQPRFCVGGSLDQLSTAERAACNAKVQQVRAVAATMNIPQDWHFVVVCDAQGWQDYRAYALTARETSLSSTAGTNVDRHETFLNGAGSLLQSSKAVEELLTTQVTLAQDHKLLLAHGVSHGAGHHVDLPAGL